LSASVSASETRRAAFAPAPLLTAALQGDFYSGTCAAALARIDGSSPRNVASSAVTWQFSPA
jgi:hypothetical protein